MEQFEARLASVYTGVERYVKYKLNGGADAEDLERETAGQRTPDHQRRSLCTLV